MIKKSLLKAANTTLKQCLGLINIEKLLIVANTPQLSIAEALLHVGNTISDDVKLIVYPSGKMNGEEPPKWIADMMMDADVIVAATEMSISHTEARRNSSKIRKSRIASMPGITEEIFIRGMAADYDEIEILSKKLKPYFDNAK
ncbi:MAG: aminopeptidase, partial [Candidatus Marinimicrobia bacterium]|nr:aminopeptidase [Candidatus Neomarinimicrobiota bacterium]